MTVELSVGTWALLTGGAALAGWIDALVGGGGLILIPLLLTGAPQIPYATVLASNKLASVSGTASAAVTLVRRVRPPGRGLWFAVPLAAVCAAAGALLATGIDSAVMRPVTIVLLVSVGIFVALRPNFGAQASPRPWRGWRAVAVLLVVGVIAAYDGFFGPGTGMFLIMAFTALLGQNFVTSAAMSKVINTATNFGALCVFLAGGHVWWTLGLVLAAANICGAQLGARTVLGGGTRLVRYALLALVVVMSAYLGYQQFLGSQAAG
ncbi:MULTISPECIES: TSUP family transporter [unclassified Corynebacterium]|uniref:TSUP family transporter n=1 Tax=unclassified Corynebacterium TaxID=2624378 RepID=UPI0029CA6425|nr:MULTISPECIES: TSUP family transporter [unclassified Corynebacterium]WPF66217.1 TSUP family transporter [Corynebacterium sp. 22KM0430]WPF68707.1 TSUP family transporter [Corynebacterium sp. 21KM1197]